MKPKSTIFHHGKIIPHDSFSPSILVPMLVSTKYLLFFFSFFNFSRADFIFLKFDIDVVWFLRKSLVWGMNCVPRKRRGRLFDTGIVFVAVDRSFFSPFFSWIYRIIMYILWVISYDSTNIWLICPLDSLIFFFFPRMYFDWECWLQIHFFIINLSIGYFLNMFFDFVRLWLILLISVKSLWVGLGSGLAFERRGRTQGEALLSLLFFLLLLLLWEKFIIFFYIFF